MIEIIIAIIFGYILGSIPFGLLLTKMAGYDDIRNIGSGNIGATNVLRTGNKKLAATTLLLDVGKGGLAVLIGKYIGFSEAALIMTAIFSILGHVFPVWLGFKGGKGVATTLGVFLVLSPVVAGVSAFIWLFMAIVFRYSSLSALTAIILSPVIAYIVHDDVAIPMACWFLAALVWFNHRSNIDRLLHGVEPKIGEKG